MPEYDFHQLSSHDLEVLSRDLLQAQWGVPLESFKSGKDGGIDLRFASGPANTIVQVKHYLRTGLAGLLRDLRTEAAKVRRLAPRRYVLITSVPLSPLNKDTIVQIIGPDLLQSADILGPDDLNNLLGQHRDIEGRHYKLWLASRGVLDRVINNAAITRSEFKARQVYEAAKRYVVSGAYPQALKMLSDERVVIIAGAPGVGKTTLADLILYTHLESGYQSVLIQRDVEEGEKLFQPGLRQIFYFDDFMGATFAGEHVGGGRGTSDRALLNFIAMVRATPNARLVLTTREHVYAQALGRSERLRNAGLNDVRVVLSMPNYDTMQRARILYNHVYFSDLPEAYRYELLRDDFYFRIVKHKKFNPRLIEWLSSYRRLKHVPADQYRRFIEELLRDPSEIWRHAYEQEITEPGRSVLLTLRSLGGKCGGPALEAAFGVLHAYRAKRHNFSTRPEDLRTGIREVINSFIKPWGAHGFEVIDPSVLDLLNAVARNAPDNALDMFAGAASFDQIEQLWTLAKANQADAIMTALRRDAGRIAASIARTVNAPRRMPLAGGGVGYFGPTFERRLATIVEMAQRLEAPAIAALIGPAYSRLIDEWLTERLQINDAVELIRAMDAAPSSIMAGIDAMRRTVLDAALEEARTGCRSDELRELLGVVDTGGAEREIAIARESFFKYQQDHFAEEIRECRSRDQFSGLIEDLELFRDELGVDVDAMIQRVEEANAEFEEYEDRYADDMHDEWKERYRDERASDRSISDMFGSMKGDGS
ncbi:restriction endonuclease [Xanthobacter autotrophicus DSM 597]|uniref:nSTAND3 domain-containing NTPase n=1 Tax=Xanthobacter wiegelii TaxID=3119913 RepID=UPI00372BA658